MPRINGAQKKIMAELPENPRGFKKAEIVIRQGKVTIRMIEANKGDIAPSPGSIAYNGTRIIEEGKETVFTTQRMPAWDNRRRGHPEYLKGKEGARQAKGGSFEADFMELLESIASRPDFLAGLSKKSLATLKSVLSSDGIRVPQLQPAFDSR